MATPEAQLQFLRALADLHKDQVLSRYVALAGAIIVIWDHLTTLDEEVKTIWTRNTAWTFPKLLFVLVRYGLTFTYPPWIYTMFTDANSPGICVVTDTFTIVFTVLGWVGQIVLCLRVWALYQRSKWMCAIMLACFAGVVSSTGLVIIRFVMAKRIHFPPLAAESPKLTGCLVEPISDTWMAVVGSIICETLVIILTLWKVAPGVANSSGSLLRKVVYSGLIYYLSIFAMLILYLVAARVEALTAPVLVASPLVIVQCMGCAKVILSLMKFDNDTQSKETELHGATSDIPVFNTRRRSTIVGFERRKFMDTECFSRLDYGEYADSDLATDDWSDDGLADGDGEGQDHSGLDRTVCVSPQIGDEDEFVLGQINRRGCLEMELELGQKGLASASRPQTRYDLLKS